MSGKAERVRLNEYTKEEWRDVALLLKPDMTDAEYDDLWDDFIRERRERQRRMGLN